MKYKLSSQQIASQVGDETVILNHQKGSYYGLDGVGVLVWDSLSEGPKTVEELCLTVMNSYEVEDAECKSDIDNLLKELIAEKLVEVAE